jgi:hypothetical protein
MYYEQPEKWAEVMKSSMRDVAPYFDAGRMADEYYERLYHFNEAERKGHGSADAQLRKAV